VLNADAQAVGRRIDELGLEEVAAEVSGIRRARVRIEPMPGTVLQAGDVVVLRGSGDAVTRAEGRLL
jgi:CPA2 family monovalent cation:H+ antiporter-2